APAYRDELLDELERRGLDGFAGEFRLHRMDTPLDWAERGMEAGTPFSLAHTLPQTGPFRPANLVRGADNVVLAGSGTRPGVGIPPVLISGRLAAERIVAEPLALPRDPSTAPAAGSRPGTAARTSSRRCCCHATPVPRPTPCTASPAAWTTPSTSLAATRTPRWPAVPGCSTTSTPGATSTVRWPPRSPTRCAVTACAARGSRPSCTRCAWICTFGTIRTSPRSASTSTGRQA